MLETDFILDKIQALYDDPQAFKLQRVQKLWSGYGEIARYSLPASNGTCIAKNISLGANTPEHPRGWNTDFSHQRKLASYYNEQRFYSHLSTFCGKACRVPNVKGSGANERAIWLVLEDLDLAGFDHRYSFGNIEIAKQCLRWLAHFHASFIAKDISVVWPIGSYWFLATRPDEWEKMPPSDLKDAAKLIDARLNNAQYQTLLHGDAKLANFCFTLDCADAAAVDFQYTGRGCGVKDITYFLGSCFNSQQLDMYAKALIDQYFSILTQSLAGSLEPNEIKGLENEWRALIPFAWADFERFLTGWSPSHKKLHGYSQVQTRLALSML